ncbi:FecR domain-containing protein [Nitrosomonas sp.]|uniref:FecR domain-containing protein n=1 Tax=Nitrosomonas sp. TaxID=42353 RepID=UPI0028421158|nr:FecR domain-containing protein [Nitrosomonas sp.]MDR4513526.1 FecR domain-containing protein [Nitrosomonas sp.]
MTRSQQRRMAEFTTIPAAMLLMLVQFVFMRITHAAEVCVLAAAQIVTAQGTVELRRMQQTNWHPVEKGTELCAGDQLRTRKHSKATLRLINESNLTLDQNSTLTFPAVQESKSISWMNLINGAIHIMTRTPKPFRVHTPFMNAGVEGTEFFVRVDEQFARIVVFEGRVSAINAHGEVPLEGHEQAIAYSNQPPRKEIILNPIDAVQWALHYPTIIEYWLVHHDVRQDFTVQIAESARLLALGSIEEAKAIIAQIRASDPDNSSAYALSAIVALTQNDKSLALEQAQNAVKLAPESATAWLALSYVEQAHFDIEEALTSVQQAAKLDPQNALIWARMAELQMSENELDLALNAANEAVRLNPAIARTQTVLGFAHLSKVNTRAAKRLFFKAIELDQTDPMPRLGLGLALIREGALEAGRIELEIAASLDPGSSLIRSYLGKAYFEEKRYATAETQFELAKERDPNDPTPWFYDAIQKQTQNQPIEALHAIQKSIELNDNRAVYRSRLLLDQDEAARGSSLSRIYDNLGFEKRAIMQTAQSLSLDPSNHSAHRFLSDIYVNIPRHEIARVSELLQAQLLQPINTNPVQPQLAVADLNIITSTGPTAVGFNEFAPLMERNRPQLVASGIVGSNSTYGNEIVYSQLYEKTSVSLGQFHYQSNGFRPNNNQNHDVLNAFIQHAFTPKLNVQAEVRTRNTKHGDLLLDFDTDKFDNNYRRNIKEDVARIGAKYELSPDQDLIVSGKYIDRFEKVNSGTLENEGFHFEAQHQLRHEYFNTVTGGSLYRFNWVNKENGIRDNSIPFRYMNRENVYSYANINYLSNLNLTLGLSYDTFSSTISGEQANKINPKVGAQWDISNNLRLRTAWFRTTKSHLIAQQTLEPTQIAGFNQFYDDINGTRSQRIGVALDYYTTNLYSGVEASKRDLQVPFLVNAEEYLHKQNEYLYRAYLYLLPNTLWSIKSEFQFEEFKRNNNDFVLKSNSDPIDISNIKIPVSVEYFHPSGFFSGIKNTFVRQDLARKNDFDNSGIDNFFLLDAFIGYRLPKRKGILSIEGRNLLDEKFFFRNINFNQAEAVSPQFVPERTFFARITLNF